MATRAGYVHRLAGLCVNKVLTPPRGALFHVVETLGQCDHVASLQSIHSCASPSALPPPLRRYSRRSRQSGDMDHLELRVMGDSEKTVRVYDKSNTSLGLMSLLSAQAMVTKLNKDLRASNQTLVRAAVTSKQDEQGHPIVRVLPVPTKIHSVTVSVHIAPSDAQVKMNSMEKWLRKGTPVRVTFKKKKATFVQSLRKRFPDAHIRTIGVGKDKLVELTQSKPADPEGL